MKQFAKRFLLLIAIGLTMGCNDTPSTEQTAAQRQDAIMANPMGYKPSVGQDVSSGDITTLDKPGLDRDLHHLLGP